MKIVKESIINEILRSEDEWADREIESWEDKKKEAVTGVKYSEEGVDHDKSEDIDRLTLARQVSNLENEISSCGYTEYFDKWRRFVLSDLVRDRDDIRTWADFNSEELQLALDEATLLLKRIKNRRYGET